MERCGFTDTINGTERIRFHKTLINTPRVSDTLLAARGRGFGREIFEALGQLGQEQWLQRHPEAGSSWPSWPKTSYDQGLRMRAAPVARKSAISGS